MADTLRCLICKSSVANLREHIREHLQYKPDKCGNCDFATWSDTLLAIHEAKTGHKGRVKATDPYRELLVAQIHEDCVRASLDDVTAAIDSVSRPTLSYPPPGAAAPPVPHPAWQPPPTGAPYPAMPPPPAHSTGLAAYKTAPCGNLIRSGVCSYGDKCRYAHSPQELRIPTHNKQVTFKTALCALFQTTGTCFYGHKCRFAHWEAELRQPGAMQSMQPQMTTAALPQQNTNYKTVLCENFERDGKCADGLRCHFIHRTVPAHVSKIRELESKLRKETTKRQLAEKNASAEQNGGPISGGGVPKAATARTPNQKRNTMQTPAQPAPTRKISLPVESRDEEAEEERTTSTNPPSKKRNRNNSANSKLQILTEDMLRSPLSSVGCRSCGKRIPEDFIARQEHCSKVHMPADYSDEDYTELLEASMRAAFPCMANNEKQCVLCQKEYSRQDGRERHVMTKHWSQTLACPLPNCFFLSVDIRKVASHMKEMHTKYPNGFSDLPRLIYNQFMQRRNEYKTRLDQAIHECFPAPLLPPARKKTQVGGTQSLASAAAIFAAFGDEIRVPIRRPLQSSSDSSDDEEKKRAEREKKHKEETAPIIKKEPVAEETDGSDSDVQVVLEKSAKTGRKTRKAKRIKTEIPETEPVKTEPELDSAHAFPPSVVHSLHRAFPSVAGGHGRGGGRPN